MKTIHIHCLFVCMLTCHFGFSQPLIKLSHRFISTDTIPISLDAPRKQVEVRIKVTNTGDSLLKIESVKRQIPSGGWSRQGGARFPKNGINPGETAELMIPISTSEYWLDTNAFWKSKFIIYSNAIRNPIITIRGYCPTFHIDHINRPYHVRQGNAVNYHAVITNPYSVPVIIDSIVSTDAEHHFSTRLPSTLSKQDTLDVPISIKNPKSFKKGWINARIFYHHRYRSVDYYEYRNHLTTRDNLTIKPDTINFGTVSQGEMVSGKFMVFNHGSLPVTLKVSKKSNCLEISNPLILPGDSIQAIAKYFNGHDQGNVIKSFGISTEEFKYSSGNTFHLKGNIIDPKEKSEHLKFEYTTYDFDTVKCDTIYKLKHTFVFENISNNTITINRVTTGDGGSMASYTRKPIPPGEKGEIEFIQSAYPRRFERSIAIGYYLDDCSQHRFLKLLKAKGVMIGNRKK